MAELVSKWQRSEQPKAQGAVLIEEGAYLLSHQRFNVTANKIEESIMKVLIVIIILGIIIVTWAAHIGIEADQKIEKIWKKSFPENWWKNNE